jgi:shikimate kinase
LSPVIVVILIGASGSGKTAIASAIRSRHPEEFNIFHFDHVGVPATERMVADYGSGEGWQRAKTIEWMKILAEAAELPRPVLFEGQTRLSFLAEGAASVGGLRYAPILVDCDDETRISRLSIGRKRPDLANATMINWAKWLRRDAIERRCEILDTSRRPLEEGVSYVVERLRSQLSLKRS